MRSVVQVVLLVGLLAGLVLPQQVWADDGVSVLVEQLKQGQVSEPALQGKGMQRADGLFLLGWLYDQGRYGVSKNPERGRELLQQAAELGQFDAMHYCWSECLTLTPAILQQLQQGVELGQPQALYLQALYLRLEQPEGVLTEQVRRLGLPQALLERAAKRQHAGAIGQLYIDQFVEWARSKRGLGEAESKLERCVDEGLTVCYYLLGALYQKHGYPQRALFNYQVLSLVDPHLYQSFQVQSQLAGLLKQRPQPDFGVERSRVASYLSQRSPTGNDRIDRFQRCRLVNGLDCVERLSQAGQQCSLEYFESDLLRNLSSSSGYRRCVGQLTGADAQ